MDRQFRMGWTVLLACCPAVLIVGCAANSTSKPQEKIKITRLDELPKHTYAVSGKASELIQSKDKVTELAEKIRANIENDLATYVIGDGSTLRRMYSTLLSVDVIRGNDESALARIEQIRALEDKEAQKLTSNLTTQASIAARREVGSGASMTAYKQSFRRHLADRVTILPWDIVQDAIQDSKGRMEIFSKNMLIGMIQAQMDPVTAKTGELNADQAASVLAIHILFTERLPLKEEIIAVYQEAINANHTIKEDIWDARSVALSEDRDLTPVLAAVWDSGTDVEVFKDRLWVNPNEQLNGKDDDYNGFIDDVHGIAFDIHARRHTNLLCPLEDAADRIHNTMKYLKGIMDLRAAVDSPEASALKRHLSSLNPADVKPFIEDLGLAGNYAHGTHVAGIIAEGNPFVRFLIARLSYDHRMVPVARTIEWGKRDGAKCRDTVGYFKKHGVRVVNMSWGEARQDAEDSLEANGIGKDADERREIARKVFALQKDGLYTAIKNAPDILFICGAGNADNDIEFDDYIPSSFDLPNLLVVGAVDQAGDPTSFTSFGRTVQVYASGFEVESYVPGGQRMKMSGTSMSSPNAANLAAMMLAVDPKLTPQQVINLIKKGSDRKTVGESSFLLMNPKRTLELL